MKKVSLCFVCSFNPECSEIVVFQQLNQTQHTTNSNKRQKYISKTKHEIISVT